VIYAVITDQRTDKSDVTSYNAMPTEQPDPNFLNMLGEDMSNYLADGPEANNDRKISEALSLAKDSNCKASWPNNAATRQ